jgi:hypothetical protein
MLFVAIEFNWSRVGGVFSSREFAEKWCEAAGAVEPNLVFEVHEFEMDRGISSEEVKAEYAER